MQTKRYANNGPTFLMQEKYYNGKITVKALLEHIEDRKKGK